MTTSLTPDQLADIRAELVTARDALLVQVASLASNDAELITARASQEERAKSAGDADLLGVERNLVARMSASMEGGLDELTSALARLDAGTYGTCTGCGHAIPAERLIARPRASRCVLCAAR